MTTVHAVRSLLLSVALLPLMACQLPGQTVPAVFVLVNGTAGPEAITVTQSPMTLTARTNKTGSGSMEFFDGTTPLGKVDAGTKRGDVSDGYDFVLSVPLAKANNGTRSYTATFVGKDVAGQPLQFTTQSTTVTVAIP
jgi:hypothetical protein